MKRPSKDPPDKTAKFLVTQKDQEVVLVPITEEIKQRNYTRVEITEKYRWNGTSAFEAYHCTAQIFHKHGEQEQPRQTMEDSDPERLIQNVTNWIKVHMFGISRAQLM